MNRLLSPLCLVLALVMLIAGFAMWSIGAPEPGSDLHQARAMGDEELTAVLEQEWERRQMVRTMLLICLFGGCGLLTLAAFATVGGSGQS